MNAIRRCSLKIRFGEYCWQYLGFCSSSQNATVINKNMQNSSNTREAYFLLTKIEGSCSWLLCTLQAAVQGLFASVLPSSADWPEASGWGVSCVRQYRPLGCLKTDGGWRPSDTFCAVCFRIRNTAFFSYLCALEKPFNICQTLFFTVDTQN